MQSARAAHLQAVASIEQTIADLAEEFALLPDWEERIAHIMELARSLEPFHDAERIEKNRVRGCVSQVWLVAERRDSAPSLLFFRGDSDSHLVRGEIGMLLRVFSGHTPEEIAAVDARAVFEKLGLKDALTAQRSNGLFAMMKRIQQEALAALPLDGEVG